MNSRILSDAADHIERYGFSPGEFHKTIFEDAEGREVDPLNLTGAHRRRDSRQCPCCPRGAIAVVTGHVPFAVELFFDKPDDPAMRAAERALVDYLIDVAEWMPRRARARSWLPDRAPELIEFWADEDGRTQDEVITTLRAAAEHERKAGR
ncbi:hypothetical protein E1264_17790 [Actinomadura sp. KC216]|uniref:DUF6197 family protein n=1 Tax=Actinomadura sp. KC216 TaxID=2530370 RepID=UPI001042D845|nr:hypothetical protein [Actinomadura sp. KC216]TDB86451.1 hypothetical protein E1264_17790 [Actinomadura sp. KC216]